MVGDRISSINVGVAGWDYRDWHGVVYPRPKPRGFDPLGHRPGDPGTRGRGDVHR